MNWSPFKIFLFFILISFNFYGQESWTLQQSIDYALEHNLQLNNLKYTIESNRESYHQSFRDMLPSVSAGSNYSIRYGRSVDPNTNAIVSSDFFSNNYYINADIDLFRGFQQLNTIKATQFLYKASIEETSHAKYLLAFRVMSAFYDVKFYEEQLEITKEQSAISLSNVNLVKKQIKLGIKAGADLYEAQSLYDGDLLSVVQSKNNLKAAKLKLLQEMNLEPQDDFQINTLTDDLITQENKTVSPADSIYQQALSLIPIIKAQKHRVKAARKNVAVARGRLLPSLTFSAGYSTGFFETNVDTLGTIIPFKDQFKGNASKYIAFSLNIPITDRWSRRSAIKQQKIALLEQENDLSIKKQELNKLIQTLVQDYNASKAEYKQTQQNTKSKSMAFIIAKKKYDKGMISIIELNQSKNAFAKAQNENLLIKSKLKVQRKTIDFYEGLPVFNINNSNE